ncbi:MAG: hypothetical protein ACKE51_07295 [Methylococcaceae bacterium]
MKKLITLAFLTLLSTFASTSSFAQTENHAGSNCVRRSGGAIAYDFHGAVYNTNYTSKSWVLCNVPHTDFDGWLNAGEINGGWFRAVDRNTSFDVKCRFRAQGVNNNGSIAAYYGGTRGTTGFGTQGQRVNLPGVSEHSHTGYVLACELPPRTSIGVSRLYTYQVRQ